MLMSHLWGPKWPRIAEDIGVQAVAREPSGHRRDRHRLIGCRL